MSNTMDAVEDVLTQSNMLCACGYCGSSATYRGKPDEINKAMTEFYEFHKRIHADDKKGRDERERR